MHYRSLFFRNPKTEAECAWSLCGKAASERYPLPLCREHILMIWSYVDTDLRQRGGSPDELRREHQELERASRDTWQRVITRNKPKPKYPDGMIYYLQVGEYIKIGHTTNPRRRGGGYPPGSKILGTHPGSREDEKCLHDKFSAYREAGREWYMDAAEIREHIAGIRAQHDNFEAGMRRRTRQDPKPKPRHWSGHQAR